MRIEPERQEFTLSMMIKNTQNMQLPFFLNLNKIYIFFSVVHLLSSELTAEITKATVEAPKKNVSLNNALLLELEEMTKFFWRRRLSLRLTICIFSRHQTKNHRQKWIKIMQLPFIHSKENSSLWWSNNGEELHQFACFF